jgi:uncharacterized protein
MSDIRIDREGVWFYKGTEMSRRDIINYFYQHLLRDESGYFIQVGHQRCRVDVEDTAYVVRAVYWTGVGNNLEENARLLLSDDSIEELDPETLRIGQENILYCGVKARRFDARFSTSSYHHLAENIRYDALNDSYFIELKGRRHLIK